MMMIIIFFLFGLIKHVSTIQCYRCNGVNSHCPFPLSFDDGDESNESNVEVLNYDLGYACLSDLSFDPHTGKETLILRGSQSCQELDVPNHRIACCYTDNCNKILPKMIILTLADSMSIDSKIESNNQHHISSIILIIFICIFQYLYYIYM